MRRLLEQGLDLHRLTRAEHQALLTRQADTLSAMLAGHPAGLVTDRTPLDFAAFWLSNGYGVDDPAATEALMARAVIAMADYSAVVLLPWGCMAIQADGVRSPNPWLQLHLQTILEGLCRRYIPGDRLLILPDHPMDPDARCAWVLDRLHTARAIAA